MPLLVVTPGMAAERPSRTVSWRAIDWRSRQQRMSVDGCEVNLVQLGQGPAILFIHGLSGCWQNWLENIPAAAVDHRVIALDLPGFGASQMPAAPISIQGYAEVCVAVCRALGIDHATVVGNSMGGFIAAELAISHPALVDRLVLVDAAGLSSEAAERRPLYTLARTVRECGFSRLALRPAFAKRRRLRQLALGLFVLSPRTAPVGPDAGGSSPAPQRRAFPRHWRSWPATGSVIGLTRSAARR